MCIRDRFHRFFNNVSEIIKVSFWLILCFYYTAVTQRTPVGMCWSQAHNLQVYIITGSDAISYHHSVHSLAWQSARQQKATGWGQLRTVYTMIHVRHTCAPHMCNDCLHCRTCTSCMCDVQDVSYNAHVCRTCMGVVSLLLWPRPVFRGCNGGHSTTLLSAEKR